MREYTLANVSKRLTKEVIQKSFSVKTNSEDELQSIIVTTAAAVGEGLISGVYRIHAIGLKYQTSFVAKGLVHDPLLRKTLECAKYFKREILFFTRILPIFKEVQQACGANESIQDYVPVCYAYHVGDDDDYILMEDLSESGYVSVSKVPTQLEKDLTLKTLAHIHAVSFALKTKRSDNFESIAQNLPTEYYTEGNRAWYSTFLKNAVDINKEIIMEYELPDSIYYIKFMDLLELDIYGQLIYLSSHKGPHSVFNHGDVWQPNFMCSTKRAKAIDFQLFRCCSLVTDLTYFLTLCTDINSKKEDYLKSIEAYYAFLKYFLNDMGINASDVYSWDDLQNELKKYGKFGLIASLTSIPLLVSDRCDVHQRFADKFGDVDRIPLERLWVLTPIKDPEQKMVLVNAVRTAVDVGLI